MDANSTTNQGDKMNSVTDINVGDVIELKQGGFYIVGRVETTRSGKARIDCGTVEGWHRSVSLYRILRVVTRAAQ